MAALCASCVCAGCGSAPPPVAPPPAPRVELIDLVPEQASLIISLHPAALLAAPASRRVTLAVISEERMERFRAQTGIDPRRLTELMLIEHPAGRVLFARGELDAPFAVVELGSRMTPVEATSDEPLPRRVGFLGLRRFDIAAIGPDALVAVEGTPELAALVLEAARHTDQRGAFHHRDLIQELWPTATEAPASVLAPRPLGLPAESGVGLLFAREEAAVVVVHPIDEALRVDAIALGEFPPGANENFIALARSIADTDLGAALGARDALPTLRIEAEEHRVAAHAELAARTLSTGLRTLLSAELRELLAEPETPPQPDATH